MAFTLDAMGDQFAGIIDLTIAYRPSQHPPLWSFLIGEQNDLAIRIEVLPVPAELMGGDYGADPAYRERFQTWLNARWALKDAWLERMISRPPAAAHWRVPALCCGPGSAARSICRARVRARRRASADRGLS